MTNPNVTLSPNMSMPIPDLSDPGSDYASNVNASLSIADAHTHTGAPTDGKQLDLSRQTTSGDVQLSDNNLGTTRSVEFVSQVSNLIGSQDVNCLCVVNNVLGFNNSAGIFVPLTGASSTAFTNFNTVTITTNYSILATDATTLINCNQPAGLTITLPRAATILPVAQSRLYLIKDISGLTASTTTITIQVAGGSGDTFGLVGSTSITINASLAYVGIYTDGGSKWYVWDQSTYDAGDVLNINGGSILFGGGGFLTGTCNMGPSFTLAGSVTASCSVVGGTWKFGNAASLLISCPIFADASNAVSLGQHSVAIAASGTTTLTGAQYNSPILTLTGVLTGDAVVALPSVLGAVWYLNYTGMTLAGHKLSVTVGSSGATDLVVAGVVQFGTTPVVTSGNFIICVSSNAFQVK